MVKNLKISSIVLGGVVLGSLVTPKALKEKYIFNNEQLKEEILDFSISKTILENKNIEYNYDIEKIGFDYIPFRDLEKMELEDYSSKRR